MVARNVRRGRNHCGAQIRGGERLVARNRGRRSDHRIESRRRCACSRESHSAPERLLWLRRFGEVRDERRPSEGGGPGFGLMASRLATASRDDGKLQVRRVHDLGNERAAAGDLDGLRAMVRLFAASAARRPPQRRRDPRCGEVRRRCSRSRRGWRSGARRKAASPRSSPAPLLRQRSEKPPARRRES